MRWKTNMIEVHKKMVSIAHPGCYMKMVRDTKEGRSLLMAYFAQDEREFMSIGVWNKRDKE